MDCSRPRTKDPTDWSEPVPACLAAALRKNRVAAEGFRNLSASCRREYIVWVGSAVRPETRERRLKETLAALAGGRRWADQRPK